MGHLIQGMIDRVEENLKALVMIEDSQKGGVA